MSEAEHDWAFIQTKFQEAFPRYERLHVIAQHLINVQLRRANLKVISISGRTKDFDSFKDKAFRKDYSQPLDQTKDIAGVRVVCGYASDLEKIDEQIASIFDVREKEEKAIGLGADKMGYDGIHYVVCLHPEHPAHDRGSLEGLMCEIQVRTILQDAWATINHSLVYKNETAVPVRLKRDLNRVSALLEIAQEVFDDVRDKRDSYLTEIASKEPQEASFLSQPLDFDTLIAYSKWKFPGLPPSERITNIALRDLNRNSYPTLKEIDVVVRRAVEAVDAYRLDQPEWFKNGTDFITKSLGFVDVEFRRRHGFASKTRAAFDRYQHLVKPAPA